MTLHISPLSHWPPIGFINTSKVPKVLPFISIGPTPFAHVPGLMPLYGVCQSIVRPYLQLQLDPTRATTHQTTLIRNPQCTW